MQLQPIAGADRQATKSRSFGLLSVIAQAMAQQIADTKTVPSSAPVDPQGRQLLSWRVHLLPYLGYDALYQKFNLNEPWDGPTNIKLSSEIPFVYSTPGVNDDRTSFELVTGPTCAAQQRRGNPVSALASRGLHKSVLVVEVADPAERTVWTKPDDLEFNPTKPAQGLTGWPDNSILAATADGVVHTIPVGSEDLLNRLFVISNSFDLSEMVASTPTVPATNTTSVQPSMPSVGPGVTPPATAGNDLDPSKLPLPTTIEIDAATLELSRLFQSDTREADTAQERAELANKLIQHAEYMKADPAKQCASLQIAYRFAVLAKSPILVKDAFDKLEARFQVDTGSSNMFIVRFGSQNLMNIPAHRMPEFRALAKTLLDNAISKNDYPAIDELIQIGTYYAASQDDKDLMEKLATLQKKTNAGKKAYETLQARLLSLDLPSLDEEGNLLVGKYWCVYRDDWRKGFQFLMRCNDERFQYLAETEMTDPIDPRVQFKIAQGWWEIGIAMSPGRERNGFLGRAAQWYTKADKNMADSLEKVTAKQQLQEFHRLTGIDDIPPL